MTVHLDTSALIDAITGPPIGRPKSATFRTLDLAGIDILAHVVRNLSERLTDPAARATFVERDRGACRVISENLEKLRLTGAAVLCRDVLDVLREERARGRRYDLVLADAPYEEWRSLEPALAELVPDVLAPDGLLVVETADRVEPELPLDLVTSRRYGSARISLFRTGSQT